MNKISKKIYWIFLSLIIALGAFLFFYRLRETQNFFYDVARDMEVVRQIIVDKKWTLLGPQTSFGLNSPLETYFGPLYYYLVAPALLFSRLDPFGPAILTAFFSFLGAILFFLFLRKIVANRWLALFGFFFYLISPLTVEYSRFPWNPNFLPFFSVLILLFLNIFLISKKWFLIMILGFLSGCLFQLHYVAAGLILALLISLFIFNPQKNFSRVFFWVSGFILGILPIIIFEIRHNFFLTKSIVRNLTVNSGNFWFSLSGIFNYLRTLIGRFFGFEQYSILFMEKSHSIVSLISVFIFATLLIFLLIDKKHKERKIILFLTVGLFLGLFFALTFGQFQKERIEDRYLLPLLPIIPTFLVLFLEKIFIKIANLKSNPKIFFFLLISLILMALSLAAIKKDWVIVNRKIGIDFNQVNLQGAQKIAEIIAKDVSQNNFQDKFNVANIVDGNSRAIYYRYFLNVLGQKPMVVEAYPDSKILYVISDKDKLKTLNYPVWEINSFHPKRISDEWTTDFKIKIYRLEN
jgi:hypothetical protein